MLIEIYLNYQSCKSDLILYRVSVDGFYSLSIPYLLYRDTIFSIHDFLLNINDIKFCLLNYKKCDEISGQYHRYVKDILNIRLQKKNEKVEFKVYKKG